MTVKDTIGEKLANAIALKHMEVINESGNHNVPAGSESHFKVVLVADEFIDQRLVARHRRVNEILADE
ncbi:MAG: BolA/IbaG family iron-sulfur metabolism protein, partial [Pseudomonadales bacterium]